MKGGPWAAGACPPNLSQEVLVSQGSGGQEVSFAYFWRQTFEYGLSKVYIFLFLYQGFMGSGGAGDPNSIFSVGIYLVNLSSTTF